MRKSIIPVLLFGCAGVAVLLALGKWQLERLAWKEAVLAEIQARIVAETVRVPEVPDPVADKYLPVEARGVFDAGALRVLVSQKQVGAGYRLVSAFETEGRRMLVDRGFVRIDEPLPASPEGVVEVTANLHWPDDRQGSTPENDEAKNIWFARDIDSMADVLRTEPVLLILREISPAQDAPTALPVDTSGIPNDHLSYALTWFSLAAIWAAMTGYLVFRSRKTPKGARV